MNSRLRIWLNSEHNQHSVETLKCARQRRWCGTRGAGRFSTRYSDLSQVSSACKRWVPAVQPIWVGKSGKICVKGPTAQGTTFPLLTPQENQFWLNPYSNATISIIFETSPGLMILVLGGNIDFLYCAHRSASRITITLFGFISNQIKICLLSFWYKYCRYCTSVILKVLSNDR